MKRSIARRLAAIPAFVLATMGAAHAEVPAGVTTAIAATGTDLVTTITAVIVAFIAFWGLKKLAQKFGWI